jgi:hypothetical protein
MAADFDVADHGSIVTFTPLTDDARDWLNEHVQAESWQWLGAGLCVDRRYAGPLIDGIADAGLEVV